MSRWILMAGAVAILASAAGAQQPIYWPAPTATTTTGQSTYFPMGTPVMLRTRTQISTKDNKPGDRVYLEVAESLIYRGQVVLPAGSVAVGEVAQADRNGHFGRKGKLDVRLLYIETPSGPVRLNGSSYDEGTSGLATSIATMALVSPLGFLVHGTSAHLPIGTTVRAYLGESLRFQEQPALQQTSVAARPDDTRPLPARFDPTWFTGKSDQTASR